MTDVPGPVEGDSEIAAPADGEASADTGLEHRERDYLDDEADEEPVRSKSGTKPSNAVLILGALLVVVIAQLVMTWFVLAATTQVRDQSTAANGLQRCIIHAQLSENSTTDPSGSAYRAAVQICVSK
jgi:flagellar basal body-associated protein FliL